MNRITLIGRLTRSPELLVTPNDISVARMTIAVDRRYRDANGDKQTDFINVVAWRTLADNCCRYLTKGKQVAVEGSLQIRSYEDRDGNKRTVAEVVADNVEFLSSASERKQEEVQERIEDLPPADEDDDDMDLPF